MKEAAMAAGLSGLSRVLEVATQVTPGEMAPLPAEPPIGGPVWTVLVPALLLLGSFLGTYFLYKRFATKEEV